MTTRSKSCRNTKYKNVNKFYMKHSTGHNRNTCLEMLKCAFTINSLPPIYQSSLSGYGILAIIIILQW